MKPREPYTPKPPPAMSRFLRPVGPRCDILTCFQEPNHTLSSFPSMKHVANLCTNHAKAMGDKQITAGVERGETCLLTCHTEFTIQLWMKEQV